MDAGRVWTAIVTAVLSALGTWLVARLRKADPHPGHLAVAGVVTVVILLGAWLRGAAALGLLVAALVYVVSGTARFQVGVSADSRPRPNGVDDDRVAPYRRGLVLLSLLTLCFAFALAGHSLQLLAEARPPRPRDVRNELAAIPVLFLLDLLALHCQSNVTRRRLLDELGLRPVVDLIRRSFDRSDMCDRELRVPKWVVVVCATAFLGAAGSGLAAAGVEQFTVGDVVRAVKAVAPDPPRVTPTPAPDASPSKAPSSAPSTSAPPPTGGPWLEQVCGEDVRDRMTKGIPEQHEVARQALIDAYMKVGPPTLDCPAPPPREEGHLWVLDVGDAESPSAVVVTDAAGRAGLVQAPRVGYAYELISAGVLVEPGPLVSSKRGDYQTFDQGRLGCSLSIRRDFGERLHNLPPPVAHLVIDGAVHLELYPYVEDVRGTGGVRTYVIGFENSRTTRTIVYDQGSKRLVSPTAAPALCPDLDAFARLAARYGRAYQAALPPAARKTPAPVRPDAYRLRERS